MSLAKGKNNENLIIQCHTHSFARLIESIVIKCATYFHSLARSIPVSIRSHKMSRLEHRFHYFCRGQDDIHFLQTKTHKLNCRMIPSIHQMERWLPREWQFSFSMNTSLKLIYYVFTSGCQLFKDNYIITELLPRQKGNKFDSVEN